MRSVYVVPAGTEVTPDIAAAAQAAGCGEVVVGVPPSLEAHVPDDGQPHVYTEPDDPALPSVRQAAAVLRSTFGTTRTAAQMNNCLDAITVILRRLAQNDLNR